jgi:hypothetical protein
LLSDRVKRLRPLLDGSNSAVIAFGGIFCHAFASLLGSDCAGNGARCFAIADGCPDLNRVPNTSSS